MTGLDQQVLSVLRGRSNWQRGKVFIGMREVSDLIARRFSCDRRPAPSEIRASVKRLVRRRLLSWAVATDDGIVYLP